MMFDDALKIMQMEATRDNRDPLYGMEDIIAALALWQTKDYQKEFELGDGVTATLTDAGHILGSAMVQLTRGGKKVVFTGDVGNIPQPLLGAPVVPNDYDYMVMESVYGDRSHEEVAERSELLKGYIEETIRTKGTLIIPAFSIERTQGMLWEINNLIESKQIAPIKTFLDSPLAIRVTEVYRNRHKSKGEMTYFPLMDYHLPKQ
jgi:metallo-beta-lactamase family protein